MTWETRYGFSRLQARALRRLAEANLPRLRKHLARQSPATPAQSLGRERPYVEARLAIDRMEDAIRKLRRIETTLAGALMTWETRYGFSRLQARALRRLAEANLPRLRKHLARQSPATPAQSLGRERPYVEARLAIDRMEDAIRKLRRIETT